MINFKLGIDEVLIELGPHKLDHSILVKKMLINQFSFIDILHYIYSEYFESLLIEKLLSNGINVSDLTDDFLE
jgi:Domain of unknown function (DUF4277)